MGKPECSVADCSRSSVKRGFCHAHYSRWNRYGDPSIQKRATSNPGMDQPTKKAWVISYKLEHGCADCGYRGHHAALDFDHLPGTAKVRDIKSGQQLGWAALQEEVAKCDVVCANCHRIRTFVRRAAGEVMSDE
jgi:hypothetical protein